MLDMSSKRAAKGGERGVNDEWYEGGKFLPGTKQPKRHGSQRPAKVRRVQIEPGVWVESTDGRLAIWGAIEAVVDKYTMVANPGTPLVGIPAAIEYYGPRMQDMIDAYNRGERWYQP